MATATMPLLESSRPRSAPSVHFQDELEMRHSEPALELLDVVDLPPSPPPSPVRQRARSTGSFADSSEKLRLDQVRPHRIRICYQDDAFRLRSEARTRSLLAAATSPTSDSDSTNSALLAKKALKYRKVLDRMVDVDVEDPSFDVSKFLGVDWCKTTSLKAHVLRQV